MVYGQGMAHQRIMHYVWLARQSLAQHRTNDAAGTSPRWVNALSRVFSFASGVHPAVLVLKSAVMW